jgi:hypothetical protein
MGFSKNTLNEIEQEMVSYLLNVDDLNYTMLSDPLITRHKTVMAPDRSNTGELEKLSLVKGLISKEDSLESMELIGTQVQMEFPKRKVQTARAATSEDEIAEDPSYSE